MDRHAEHPVIGEAKKFFPAIKPMIVYSVGDKGGNKFYTVRQLKAHVIYLKMKVIERWLRKNHRVRGFRWSSTTNSMYFTIANINFRISDHSPNKYFSGIGIILNWRADPIEVIQHIIYESWSL